MNYVEIRNDSRLCGPSGPLLCHKSGKFEERPEFTIHHSFYASWGTFEAKPLHSVYISDENGKVVKGIQLSDKQEEQRWLPKVLEEYLEEFIYQIQLEGAA